MENSKKKRRGPVLVTIGVIAGLMALPGIPGSVTKISDFFSSPNRTEFQAGRLIGYVGMEIVFLAAAVCLLWVGIKYCRLPKDEETSTTS